MDQQQQMQQPVPHGVSICMEKNVHVNVRSRKERHSIQRALGFKNVVIYILIFVNLLLCSKLFSIWSRQQDQQPSGREGRAGGRLSFSTFSLSGEEAPEHEGEDASTPEFWLKMALIVFLVLIGGLTIGLMGLDETNLHVLMASGTPTEQVHAETVHKLLSRGKHWVLVTLLLGNVIVNETLPVVLDSELGGGIVAILISTLLIVIFGEIIPQAVCARYGLAIGSYCAKPMLIFMYIMSPAAYPIAMLLDSWLGVHHGTTYRRTELKTLVSLHQVDGIGELTDDEVTIIASVLDLKEKSVAAVMTPLEDVFTLSEDAILDEQLMEEIVSAGYSRIPIYRHDDPSNFIGMLLVKRLITYDPEDHIPVRQFTINALPEAAPNTSCLDILNFFQEGRSHMAMVTSEPGGFGVPVGVITLEDVIEELLGEEIVDESDVYVDIHNKIRVIRKPSRNVSMIKNLKTLLRSPALSDSTPLLGRTNSSDRHGHNVDGTYMSTGKTILQSRKSSSGLLEGVPAAAANATKTTTVTAAKHVPVKGPATVSKGDEQQHFMAATNGNKDAHAHVVNFKDTVEVIKSSVEENGAANGASNGHGHGHATATLGEQEVSEPVLITLAPEPITETTMMTETTNEPEGAPLTTRVLVTEHIVLPVAEVASPVSQAAAVVETTIPPTTTTPVVSSSTTTANVPETESTSTVATTGENTNPPSPGTSKKKKKKKKSTK
ncbi:hypothetical protein BGX28_007407 [Mortierella sp. GBA30]|nr:hypothetical protein BGX28_007407 [Mortierella sp. GBA30]